MRLPRAKTRKARSRMLSRTLFCQGSVASNSARVGFTANGVEGNPVSNSNYFVIPAGTSSARLEIKCDQIWLAGDGAASTVSLVAGYTNIPKTEFVGILSGSKGFSGIG